ncbi:MAG: ABC transporter ATP-binding protein [Catenulispora sp.]
MTTFAMITRHSGRWLPVIGATALVGTVGSLLVPTVLGRAIDAIVSGTDGTPWLAAAVGLMALGVVCDALGAYAGAASVAGTTAWLRSRLLRHVLDAGPAGTGDMDTGDLVSRISGNAVEAARAGPSIVGAVAAALPAIGALVFLAVIDPWLAVTFLAGLAAVAAVVRAFARRTSKAMSAYLQAQGGIAARLAEALGGVRTIAAAGTADRERDRILQDLPDLRTAGLATWRVIGRSTAQGTIVAPAVLVAVLAVGGVELSWGRISVGDLFAASRYAALGLGLGGLTAVYGTLARSRAAVARVGGVLALPGFRYGAGAIASAPESAPESTPESTHESEPESATGRLEFRAVSVDGVLTDLDFEIPGGTVVAVVGPSGSGKSVLAEAAVRLRDPDAGQVLLDGVPLPELGRAALREAVGCAFERPQLVGRTVGDAIGLGRSRDQVLRAARDVRADTFIRRLPDGYDTPLTNAPMSGGESQRIGLARAWPARRLLVLDDATSSLDTVTETQITETLLARDDRRTRIIITHRARTAARADLVLWLDGGRLRALGPHAKLCDDPDYRRVFGQ